MRIRWLAKDSYHSYQLGWISTNRFEAGRIFPVSNKKSFWRLKFPTVVTTDKAKRSFQGYPAKISLFHSRGPIGGRGWGTTKDGYVPLSW